MAMFVNQLSGGKNLRKDKQQVVIPFLNQDEHAKASEQRQGSTMSTVRSGAAQPTK
jgi:hypothetical protein